MKMILRITGVLLMLAGGAFFLQGIGVLPGRFMSGDPQWAINGGVMLFAGLVLLYWSVRRR